MPVVRKIRCRISKIITHGDHVYTIYITPESRVPRFIPGQFLHLAIDDYDPSGFWPDSRVFSIASSPDEYETLEIQYSVQGRFTARMESELITGSIVWVKLPYGEFIIRPGKDIALFAGGTGISAFTAFLYRLDANYPDRVNLFYGARTLHLLTHLQRMEDLKKRAPQFQTAYFVEQTKLALPTGEIPGICIGRLSVQATLPCVRDPDNTDFFLSGPPPMLSAIKKDLQQEGIAETSIHIDAW